jgi:hypothetical protein
MTNQTPFEPPIQPIAENLWWVIPGKLAGVRKPTILELLEACDHQVKYQCSILSSHNLAFVAQ